MLEVKTRTRKPESQNQKTRIRMAGLCLASDRARHPTYIFFKFCRSPVWSRFWPEWRLSSSIYCRMWRLNRYWHFIGGKAGYSRMRNEGCLSFCHPYMFFTLSCWDMSKKSVDPNLGEKFHPLQQEEWHPDSSHNMKKPRKWENIIVSTEYIIVPVVCERSQSLSVI